MNPAISRRTAIKGTTGALIAVAAGATACPASAATAAQDKAWTATSVFGAQWDMTSRVVSRLPVSARYGQPVPIGQVTVQAICPGYFVEQVRDFTDIASVSATGECSITIVDARGLTAHATVGLTFPPTSLPDDNIDFTITGTAAITHPVPLPLPRNRGPMRISLDPEAVVTTNSWQADGTLWAEGIAISLAMKPDQDPFLATIDIR